ncbi:MAG: hypothetical protein ACREU3_17400 [Steroidobacteraceae bacterium]
MRRRLTAVAVTVVAVGASAGVAGASSAFQLSVSPARVARGGTVTITTAPRQACRLTVSIAKKRFSHAMPYGWIQVRIPRKDSPGRVPVKVNCGGHVTHGAFRVKR